MSVHWNGTEDDNRRLANGPDLASGSFHHCKVILTHVPGGAIAAVSITENIDSFPGATRRPILVFIPGLNPFDCRVEFAARSGALDMNVDLDNVNVLFTNEPLDY